MFGDHLKDEPVSLGEHFCILNAKRGQIVDVEKTAIIDLVQGHTPRREAIMLRLEYTMEIAVRKRVVYCIGCFRTLENDARELFFLAEAPRTHIAGVTVETEIRRQVA